MPLPDRIRDVDHLEELLSEPTPSVVETMRRLEGDILLLGVGGKMGPSLARMAKRASDAGGVKRRVIGVSRFSTPQLPKQLNEWGIETITADLLDPGALASLPDVPNVVYMAAMKFGTTGQAGRTWAMNAFLPGMVAQQYRHSRIVAFSTGNVYPLAPAIRGGSVETDELVPVGEYGQSALARERIFEHFSRTNGTPMSVMRLNYAVEMRYGVLVDLANKVWTEQPVDIAMCHFNCIWQADANAVVLQAFDHVATPPFVLNVTGPEVLSVRQVCEAFAMRMKREVTFAGTEAADALLSNAGLMAQRFGAPSVPTSRVIEWTADWVMRGGASLGKPTHFETRDGKF
jgi:nucleoside-diphosphate-sugar epimerase